MTQATNQARAVQPVTVPGDEGEARWWFGAVAVVKATAADTGGRISIVEVTEPPGAEAPLHVHHREDEGFWILDGDITFEVGGTTFAASAGDFAFGPLDIPHRYKVGDAGCRMLFLLTPGGFEGAIMAMRTPARTRTLPPASEQPPDVDGIEHSVQRSDASFSARRLRASARSWPAKRRAKGAIVADGTETVEGSAGVQGELWGERARDWADVLEGWNGWGIPLYRHVLERVPVGSGTKLLDVGCGAGRFCRIAADRGAQVAGLDAAGPLIEIARERVPDGDFRVGEMEDLPWADDTFDVVTGFNSFFIAADIVNALREARRVARPAASMAMTVFGRPERCESTAVFASLAQFAPSRSSEEKEEGPVLHEEGALERVAAEAGLTPIEAGYVQVPEEYPDLETMLRGYMAAAPFVRAARAAGEEAVRDALSQALQSLKTSNGRYRLEDELRYLIAVA